MTKRRQERLEIARRQVLAGGVAAGAVWTAPSLTKVAVAAAQQSVVCAGEPLTCGAPFGAVTHTAAIEGSGLGVTYTWSAPVAGRRAEVAAWALCDGASTHGVAALQSPDVASSDLRLAAFLADSLLDTYCPAGAVLTVRAALVWVVAGVVRPLAIPGSAVVDVVLSRSGGAYQVVSSTQRTDLGEVCFPLAP